MAILTSFLLFGDAHAIGVTLEGEDQKRVDILNKSLPNSRYAANKATYMWAKFFEKVHQILGRGSPDLLAILFHFPSCHEDGLHSYVFSLIVLLAKGIGWPSRPFI